MPAHLIAPSTISSLIVRDTLNHPNGATNSPVSPELQTRAKPGKALAAVLLAAFVSALVVAADSVAGSYADDHLLIGWISLWAVGFAAMALFANTARNAAVRLSMWSGTWAQRRTQRRSDADLLAAARRDPRIMAEIEAAMQRANAAKQCMNQALGRAWLERLPVGTLNASYQGPRMSFRTTPSTGLPTHLQNFPG